MMAVKKNTETTEEIESLAAAGQAGELLGELSAWRHIATAQAEQIEDLKARLLAAVIALRELHDI